MLRPIDKILADCTAANWSPVVKSIHLSVILVNKLDSGGTLNVTSSVTTLETVMGRLAPRGRKPTFPTADILGVWEVKVLGEMMLMALIVWLRTVSGRVSLVRLKVKEAVVPGREDNMGMRTKASTITLFVHNRNL